MSHTESEERRLLRSVLKEARTPAPLFAEIDALLARHPTGWVAIYRDAEDVLHFSRAKGWRVEEVMTESAAPQPLTADPETAPSNEGVGPGEVAVAADSSHEHTPPHTATSSSTGVENDPMPGEKLQRDSPTWDEVDAIRKGKSDIDLAERIWQLERELAEMSAINHRLAANQIGLQSATAYWKDKAEAAQEIANEATLLLEGQGAQSATGWIACSERMPSEGADKAHPGDTISKWLLVECDGYIPQIARYHWPTDSWETPDKEWPALPIARWMPLPAAPDNTKAQEGKDG